MTYVFTFGGCNSVLLLLLWIYLNPKLYKCLLHYISVFVCAADIMPVPSRQAGPVSSVIN